MTEEDRKQKSFILSLKLSCGCGRVLSSEASYNEVVIGKRTMTITLKCDQCKNNML
jgi:hypothetical protein